MSIVNSPSSPSGIDVVRLLSDPIALKAEYERLSAEQKRASDLIALVGPAEDVLRLREEAQIAQRMASAALDKAQHEAAGILAVAESKAATEYGSVIGEAKKQAKELLEKAKMEADALMMSARELMSQAQVKMTEVEAQRAAAILARKQAEADVVAYAEKFGAMEKAIREAETCKAAHDAARQRLVDAQKALMEVLGADSA